jgi:hypothetical protein
MGKSHLEGETAVNTNLFATNQAARREPCPSVPYFQNQVGFCVLKKKRHHSLSKNLVPKTWASR